MQVNVLGVRSWSLRDEKTGRDLSGVSVHYFDPADTYDSTDQKGIFPRKITGDKSLLDKFTKLPAKYDFDLRLKASSGGRTGVELADVSLVS